jgi:hypothetical protein
MGPRTAHTVNATLKEVEPMEWLAAIPDWLVWGAAGGAGALFLRTLAGVIEAALDLEAR